MLNFKKFNRNITKKVLRCYEQVFVLIWSIRMQDIHRNRNEYTLFMLKSRKAFLKFDWTETFLGISRQRENKINVKFDAL